VLFNEDPPGFNDAATASITFGRRRLSETHMQTIGAWPLRDDLADLVLTHGSFGRRRYTYVTTPRMAMDAFTGFVGQFGAVGHTHIPAVFVQPLDGGEVRWVQPPSEAVLRLPPETRIIVNPGSIGQPRDGNPDASWGLLDTDERTFQVRRTPYDIDLVQRKIDQAGLPPMLGERLRIGA